MWWWHLEFKETCLAEITTTFVWSVKIKSIQGLAWGSRSKGSDISLWKLCKDMNGSKYMPSTVVLSFFYQDEDLALTSPKIMVNKELAVAALLKSSSKSDRKFKFSNSLEICRQCQNVLSNLVKKLHFLLEVAGLI